MGTDSALNSTNPTQRPTQEEDSHNSSNPSRKHTTTIIFISLLLITCIAISAASAFAFFFSSTSSSSSSSSSPAPAQTSSSIETTSRALIKLNHPVVILISSDGFRFGYQFKTPTPNIHRLIANGTEAVTGLIPVFPTVTFPNHYSIVTGLYPAYHGIINNRFVDPITGEVFTMRSHEPKWWLGEPLWETVANHGLRAATYFGLGLRCIKVLGIALKGFGHLVGPDDPEITEAVSGIDKMIGRLINGLEKRGVFEDVHIIMVGDHGMYYTPVLSIRPPPGVSPSSVVGKINEGLQSGKVQNGKHLKVYLKEELPSRLHYSVSDRIPPIIGLVEEGFEVEQKRSKHQECGGAHGYDNAFFSMRTIFIGHGPHFARGRKVPSFENIQIYNLVTSILNIKGAPNNGSLSFPGSVLLPTPW
ncbi:hypothetical protein GH714_001153 [Hevea brasiliensis]|uniref:Uncharacterized protein n=1 Tax=Hevea brasiliensis TaxID=3981 RepID=A0A6A6N209_HEVBR|nr:hypothetical protein GH714_001153 [Hevea brasiliensis]